MKQQQLSESLEDLAARDKRLEHSATVASKGDPEALEERRRESEKAFMSAMEGIEASVRDADAAARERWNDTRSSITRQIEAMRAARRRRQDERGVDRAKRAADRAEQDAAAAVAVAAYCMNVAEYAVVDAALARAEANELSDQT
jgi:hypothetical protein